MNQQQQVVITAKKQLVQVKLNLLDQNQVKINQIKIAKNRLFAGKERLVRHLSQLSLSI